MKKSTVRVVTTKNVHEDKVLARRLNYLQQSQTVASLEHDRAQTAFMKRYSALLKRKTCVLSSSKGKPLPSNGEVNFLVSGAGLVKNKGQEKDKYAQSSALQCQNVSIEAVNQSLATEKSQSNIQSQIRPSTTASSNRPLLAGHQRVIVPNRLASRSAPSQRHSTTGLPFIGDKQKAQQVWQITDKQHSAPSSSWCHDNSEITERKILKAWSPDLRVTSYSPTDTDTIQVPACTSVPSELDTGLPSNSVPIRGILVNRHVCTYPLRYSGDILQLRAELLARNGRHSIPCGTADRGKPEAKKRVTFIESQIVGHEAADPLYSYKSQHDSLPIKGLNIVTLFNDTEFIQKDFSRSTPNFLF